MGLAVPFEVITKSKVKDKGKHKRPKIARVLRSLLRYVNTKRGGLLGYLSRVFIAVQFV